MQLYVYVRATHALIQVSKFVAIKHTATRMHVQTSRYIVYELGLRLNQPFIFTDENLQNCILYYLQYVYERVLLHDSLMCGN